MSLLGVLLATGCATAIGGKAVPAPNQLPHPVIGEKVKQVLPDSAALSKLLDRPFQAISQFPPVFGGGEILEDDYPSTSPAECMGVVYMAQKSPYQSADVKNVARELWQQEGSPERAIDIAEGVVALPTMADAIALFAKFSAQWQQCDAKTLTVPASSFVQNVISDVRVKDSVVAAGVSREPGDQSILVAVPEVRALGVRGNCLVEVEAAFVGSTDLTDQPSAKTDAVAIAHAMMDKVSALS
ncbi:sensor domain-containing protein [Mycobacterium montefiorense]|uniref:Sensor domain-containing protein n=1 Tax=Mycobacterium montefiorense TaxID=154654 RepID=A0AA37PSS8_9MYCO|nr:sensor domain-containing protein [Mycobacterium montefiorense]GBG39914.1 sensor domain-containing protein [Mycobacterium montefiorense]GKU36589.1 sensor domain-containing protein [Mycobacterium montefiorense]GKU38692.1 sensor domain-containing protein [Mycobacterium montefiorense]GKU46596.1 sensor domain-containing protein [Mycobacterium montefiorense]GKU48863.1 sensor domain-containing protein [Mycobacterium montefiorense]